MQLKGLVRIFTILLILFSLERLSYTFIARSVEKKITAEAERKVADSGIEIPTSDRQALVDVAYTKLTDSLRGETVFSFLGLKYSYQEIKEKELQLGLDLQGGMSVTLEVGVDEMLKSMCNRPQDPAFLNAVEEAVRQRANSDADFITLFGDAYLAKNPNAQLASLFTGPSQSVIKSNSSNAEVLSALRKEATDAVSRTYNVLQARIDRFGVAQPSINLNKDKGIITVELAGVRDPESVRRTLQATAKLQFWEVADNMELASNLNQAHDALTNYLRSQKAFSSSDTPSPDTATITSAEQSVATEEEGSLSSLLEETSDNGATSSLNEEQEEGLFTIMMPIIDQQGMYQSSSVIGIVEKKNADRLMEYLNLPVVKSKFPANIKFLYGEVPGSNADKNDPKAPLGVYAVKTQMGKNEAKLEGDMVKSAKFDYQPQTGQPEIKLEMTQQGAAQWAILTETNIGRSIAIALDDYIYSAPTVQNKITGGSSSITGNFTAKTGTELANILETGKLDAPAVIVQEQIVGPTLGLESAQGGLQAFIISFIIIFSLMIVYYNTGGVVANIALLLNLLFTFGILAYMGATLTMPGIAGLVLGIGMSVDVNVIIFERIKEELDWGKSYREAVDAGYKRSYAPVLDSHITSLITAIVLYIFGMGPILGFATTQILALTVSLFSGILISRLVTDIYMRRGKNFLYFTNLSKSLFKKANFNFIGARKKAYVFSTILVVLGLTSFINGFDYGVEFQGGRSYTIKLEDSHKVSEVREKLEKHLGDKYPVVKTIGSQNHLNITTDYLIDKPGKDVDNEVLVALHGGLVAEGLLPSSVDFTTFNSTKYIENQDKVLPVISEDLKKGAVYASVISVILIFIYIIFRFRKWQYSVGTIVSLVHDAAVVLAIFSFFRNIVPFSLEIDQHFIAAMLTVLGFSMNDTVVVFDRIREYFSKNPNEEKKSVVNRAINHTLSRTVMTTVTVFLTLLVLFIFGGETLRGFSFALMIGVVVGSYSSIFVAAPIMVDLDKKNTLSQEEDKEEKIRLLKEQA